MICGILQPKTQHNATPTSHKTLNVKATLKKRLQKAKDSKKDYGVIDENGIVIDGKQSHVLRSLRYRNNNE